MEILLALQGAGAGTALVRHLEERLGPVSSWWSQRRARTLVAAGVRPGTARRLASPESDRRGARALAELRRMDYHLLPAARVPCLAELPDPPLLLLVKGSLPGPEVPALSVVGARRATGYGRRTARRLAGEVAAAGVPVVSGLARGIDAEAHRGALEVGGRTVAVLGAGPGVAYPPEHAGLQEEVAAAGAVVTEFLPGTPPRPHHFPRRNRLMVVLGRALLLVEARLRSGSLTSVRWAADLGRDVLVVPGPVDSPLSEGPVALLREGATPVAGARHVLEALGVDGGNPVAARTEPGTVAPSPAEARLLVLLAGGPLDLDALVRLAGEPPGRVMTLLLGLEMRGLVTRDAGMAYRACGPPVG